MWNKNEQENKEPTASAQTTTSTQTTASRVGSRQAILGPSIAIKGDLAGEEDLLIEGRVEGQVSFRNNTVTIGASGQVKADVYCKTIQVEGLVEGNLHGEERIVIRKSGRVEGNAIAPRVILEDGSRFRGNIEMGGQPEPAEASESPSPKSESKSSNATAAAAAVRRHTAARATPARGA